MERPQLPRNPARGGYMLNLKKLGIEIPIVASCIIAVYWHDMTILWDDALNNEMASYILALPFLIAYMIYKKRNMIKAQLTLEIEDPQKKIAKDTIGVSLCLSALLLYVYGSFTFNTLLYHLISLAIFTTGCAVLLTGIQNLKNLAFPLGFLLLLIIPYREEAYQAGAQLSTLTSTLTYNILRTLNYPVTLSSTYQAPSIMIQTPTGEQVPFIIDIPCAGAYSLIGFLVFALFFTYIAQGTPPRKIGWLITGFILIYAINIARTTLTLIIGYQISIEAAMGLFHLLGGTVLIFLASLSMILIGEKMLKVDIFRKETKTEPCLLCEENQRRNELFCTYCGRFFKPTNVTTARIDLGKIVALAITMALIINMQVPAFTLAQHNIMEMDLQELAGQKETRTFLPPLEGYEPKFVYRDQRFETIAGQDASLLYVYYPQNESYAPVYVSIEIANSHSKLHRWEICLFASEPDPIVDPIVTKDIQIIENPPVTGRIFTFRYVRSNQPVTILYWYEKSTFRIGQAWANRYIKTSIIAYLESFIRTGEITSVNDHTRLESKLTSIAQNIITYWEPAKTWSAFVVAVAGWGQTLAIATMIASSSLVTILHLKKRRDKEETAKTVHKQLTWHSTFSKEEREILKVLETLAKVERSTGTELAESYKSETGKEIEPKKLMELMTHAERYQLLTKGILNREGNPTLFWKAHLPSSHLL